MLRYVMLTMSLILGAVPVMPVEKPAPNAVELNAEKLMRLGMLLARIGSASGRLNSLMERGSAQELRYGLRDMHREVDEIGAEINRFTDDRYRPQIAELVRAAHQNLERIEASVDDNDLERAQQEYRSFVANWERMDDYVVERLAEGFSDKEEVKGWVAWIIDLLYTWFQDQPSVQSEP